MPHVIVYCASVKFGQILLEIITEDAAISVLIKTI